jgi:hypothetical protein
MAPSNPQRAILRYTLQPATQYVFGRTCPGSLLWKWPGLRDIGIDLMLKRLPKQERSTPYILIDTASLKWTSFPWSGAGSDRAARY